MNSAAWTYATIAVELAAAAGAGAGVDAAADYVAAVAVDGEKVTGLSVEVPFLQKPSSSYSVSPVSQEPDSLESVNGAAAVAVHVGPRLFVVPT